MSKFAKRDCFYPFALDGRGNDLFIPNIGYNDYADPNTVPVREVRTLTYCTLQIVLRGSGYLVLDGITHRVGEGDVFFLPENIPLAYYPDDDDPYEYVWFSFHGSQAYPLLSRIGISRERPIAHTSLLASLRHTLNRLFRSMEDTVGDPYYLALSVFYDCIHLYSAPSRGRSAADARRMIDANYTSHDFSIELMCESLHISHSHLCRLFKNTYGVSAARYLGDLRLTHARRLLEATDMPIKAVAFSCGFRDELHFMKRFKAETGTTARAYRLTAQSVSTSPSTP